MESSNFSTIQYVIAVGAILYCIAPDFFIGPFDDILVASVAAISDIILAVSKPRITIEESGRDINF